MSTEIRPPDTQTESKGLRTLIDQPNLLWLDLDDPMSVGLDDLAKTYGFHELTVEDCRHGLQLAKIEHYGNYCFIIINTTHYTDKPCTLNTKEIDVYLGSNYIITVHFGLSNAINELEKKIAAGNQQLTRPDKIFHAIIDIVVDRYLPTLDQMGDTIDDIEDELLVSPHPSQLETIFSLKRGLLQFRRAVSSQRELLNAIVRDESDFVRDDMTAYFRDVYDHAVRAMDLVETYRDLLSGSLDIYLTQMANRTNDIVKGLTILATIMLPLTLVTGYFGMNFDPMPLLKTEHGWLYCTLAMVMITLGMLSFFKYKKWL